MKKIQITTSTFFLAVVFATGGNNIFAQSSSNPESATVEKIMEQAVRNLTMRYNLNDQQNQKTQEIMTRRVQEFLRDHENEVWPVIRDLLKTGIGTRPPEDSNDVKRIGTAALPLIELAKKAIYDGNDEWRQFLTPDQQRMHDFDLAEMDRSFGQIEQNFQKWANGKATNQLFPPPNQNAGTPPRPMKPPLGLPKSQPVMFDPFRIFSVYVEDFIKEYDLSEGQIDTARSILKEFRTKATDFKLSNQNELRTIEKDYTDAQEAGDRKKLAQAEAKRKVLLKPIYRLFSQMVQRLKAQLTSTQLQQFDAADQTAQEKESKSPLEDAEVEQKNKENSPEPQKPPADNKDGE